MRKGKKLLALLVGTAMVLGIAACGGGNKDKDKDSAKGKDETFKVSFDNTLDTEVLDAIPEYQFIASDLRYMIPYGVNLDVTLELKADGTYKLKSAFYNQDVSVKEGDPAYLDLHAEATGTYTKEGDKATISAAETATQVFQGGAYCTEQGAYASCSFNDDGSVGEWSGEDIAEVLECIPETIFTVTDDGAITTWEAAGDAKGNPHADMTAGGDTQTP